MGYESGPTEDEMSLGSKDHEAEKSQEVPNLLTEVEPIKKTFQPIHKREDLKEVIEPPLLTAREELYDKNIRTISTSANRDNLKRRFCLYLYRLRLSLYCKPRNWKTGWGSRGKRR